MLLPNNSQFSEEDYQLSAAYRLGAPLAIYRLKPGFTNFYRIMGLLIFSIGILALCLVTPELIQDPEKFYSGAVFPAFIGGIYAIINGGFFYGLVVRRLLSTRAIVCEHGLLQVRKIFRHNRIEAINWQESSFISIEKADPSGYTLAYRDHGWQCLPLSSAYQDLDELVSLIKQHQTSEEEDFNEVAAWSEQLPTGEKE